MKHVTVKKLRNKTEQYVWKFNKNTLTLVSNSHIFTQGIIFQAITNILKRQLKCQNVGPDNTMFETRDKTFLSQWRYAISNLSFNKSQQLKTIELQWKNSTEFDDIKDARLIIEQLNKQIIDFVDNDIKE